MKKIGSICLFLVLTFSLFAQNGNQWIDYDQKYYEIKVVKDGIYRIDYTVLQAAIPSMNTIDASNFQIFGKDRETPIYVNDGGDGLLNTPGDFIEFVGEKNDGWLDSLLYNDPEAIGNPYYSLFNDTLVYFLTWNNSNSNLRFQEETDVDFLPYTPRLFFLDEVRKALTQMYYAGNKDNGNPSSFYDDGEGFISNHVNGAGGTTTNHAFSLSGIYQGAGAADIEFHGRFSSNSSANSDPGTFNNHHSRIRFGNSTNEIEVLDEVYYGYKSYKFEGTFPAIQATTNTNYVYHDIINDLGAVTDFQALNYFSVVFPKIPSFNSLGEYIFEIPFDNSLSKSYYEVPNSGATIPSLYVLGSENYKIPVVLDAGVQKFLVPKSLSGMNQKAVFADETKINLVTEISPVNQTGNFVNYFASNIEDAFFIISESSLMAEAQNYQSYRSSASGGGHNTVLVDVNHLYGQFGGGVNKHPLAIKRFLKEVYQTTTNKPKAIFLLGKSIGNVGSQGSRLSAASFDLNLVPSFGDPVADNYLTIGLSGQATWVQDIPIGRIAANSNADIADYLVKVKAYENNQDQNSFYDAASKEWQKQVIHFGGGADYSEQQTFANRLNTYKGKIEGADFGGSVYTYLQQSSEPINPVILTELNELIANGASLMTFYGHAVTDGFDINIDDPNNWGNFEKYPFVIGNSCYTGNIHKPDNNSVSESFVFADDAGAIGMMSSVNLGFAYKLYEYTTRLYDQFSTDGYGLPIGEQAKNASQALFNLSNFTDYLREQTATQMTLHCDPLIKINYHEKPEIDVTTQSVYVTPEEIDLSVVNFDVHAVVTNLGRAITDSVNAELTRIYPNGNGDTTFFLKLPHLYFKDTITFSVPLNANLGIGLNEFQVRVDLPSFYEEQSDDFNNNQIIHNFSIKINGITPVYPYNYAVVPRDTIKVKASTIDPVAPFNTYVFEIDTTDLYNSPEHRRAYVNGLGGVKTVNYDEWKDAVSSMIDPLVCEDSTVYFWRVAIDSSVLVWQEHSFQYIKGKEGWGQDHFFQFKNNDFNQVEYNRTDRLREFNQISAQLYCQVYGNGTDLYGTEWGINGQTQEYAICGWTPSIQVAVIDNNYMSAWLNCSSMNAGVDDCHYYGDVATCRPWRQEKYFTFRQNDPVSMAAMQNMITNEIPDSHFVFIYAPVKAYYQHWDPSYYAFFQGLGSTEIYDGRDNAPFINFFQVGNPASFQEVHAVDSTDFIEIVVDVLGSGSIGEEISPIVGPASEWNTIYWKQDSVDAVSYDSTRLQIRAFSNDMTTSMDVLFTPNDSIINLNSMIDASLYPYIQLKAVYRDSVAGTPAQLDRWHILFQPVPEMAIDGSNGYYISNIDSISEGQSFQFAIDMVNISDWPMDSLLVHYYLEDQQHNLHYLPYDRQDSLRVGERMTDTIDVNTFGFPGLNSLWVEANPYTENGGLNKDQWEQYHFNNLVQIPFFVHDDNINPILDVTFDGNHIINGDIVNPQSEIVITLKDENTVLVMDDDSDTSKFAIYLTNPQGIQKKIPFMSNGVPVLQWVPADASNLKFKIIYIGSFDLDGTYSLLVQGSDLSNNLSGDSEYRISFEVIHASTITHLMNYPNPFSTSTKFVFTLTGSQIPDNMIIQILSVTGKVVREITQAELGTIKIGRNITDYAWDGKDAYGDQLANGIYLYRVITNLEGESIEHRSSGADEYFKKGFGKMYLIR